MAGPNVNPNRAFRADFAAPGGREPRRRPQTNQVVPKGANRAGTVGTTSRTSMSTSPAGRRNISADLVRYINPTLGDKMLFASDWAVITPGRRISPGPGSGTGSGRGC